MSKPFARPLPALALLLIALAAFAPSASAKIVLGKSVAGVALGDKGSEVRAVLGKPPRVVKYSGGQSWYYKHESPAHWVTLTSKARVVGLETDSTAQRTKRGIGPGSSLEQFKAAYPRAKCHTTTVGPRVCSLFTKVKQRRIRSGFVFFDGKCGLVDVGRIGEFG